MVYINIIHFFIFRFVHYKFSICVCFRFEFQAAVNGVGIGQIVNIDFVFNIKQLIGFDRQKTFDVFLLGKQFQRTFVKFVFGYFLQRITGNLAHGGVFTYPAGSFQFRRRIYRATDGY